jgi:catechol 2,3-dioxygenase-like lactoylglutathione lyase family enzyme
MSWDASPLSRSGRSPIGTFMQDLLDVHPRAVIEQITMVRCGRSANIELFEYTAPDQRTTFPRNSDWSGHHIAFYVTDIDAAVAYMVSKGAQKFLGPLPVTDGPAAGQSINYFRTPFGTYVELISYPDGMAYERDPSRPLWSPKRNGTTPVVTSVPGLLGIDHVGITVPDVPSAVAWFEDALGCASPLAFGPFLDPTGTFMQDLLDVHPRAVIDRIQHVRCGNGPSVELFQYQAPDQDRTFRRNSDYGGKHVAFYVRHIDKAVARVKELGAQTLLGPLPVTEGPAAGQSINYVRTPFGTYVELISYPAGMAYAATTPIPLWDPRDNRP